MTSESPVSLTSPTAGVEILGPVHGRDPEVLTPEALAFAADLQRRFWQRREELLDRRRQVQERLDSGWRPDFLAETGEVRAGDWRIEPVPSDLEKRVVEITGPVDRKMVINALNSGADVFMADFEDSNSPTWRNTVEGQINLMDAVRRTVSYDHPQTGKHYELAPDPAVLVVRPRGWHLLEKHVLVDGRACSASLFDFALYFFHNAKELLARGTGPYFYLPKLESHLEARLWNEVFVAAQEGLGLPLGTIKATVLIETIMAAFEMDEILYELRQHSSGLNCGRWDYIFSFIKRFRSNASFVLPDRSSVGMDRHFLHSYSQLLIRTCHRRGAHAMGGMAAQIPVKDDPERNAKALEKVHQDKRREANDGHDGTWVAHPALVAVAREEFERVFQGPNQLDALREDVEVGASDLLRVPEGTLTEAGLRQNLNVGILYLEAWLRGTGCVPIYGLMEDAATAEISRTQVWQWLHHGAKLQDGRAVDATLFHAILGEELQAIRTTVGEQAYAAGRFALAADLFQELITSDQLEEFLTLPAYESILTLESR